MLAQFLFAVLAYAGQDLNLETIRLATVPDDYALEGQPMIGPDGKEYPVVMPIVWGPLGRSVAYVALKGNKRHPILGDEVLGAYDYAGLPIFSANGEHTVFRVGNAKSKKTEVWWTLLDGKKKNKSDWLGLIQIMPEGDPVFWEMPGAKIESSGAYNRRPQLFQTPFKKGKRWADARALRKPVVAEDGSWCATLASKPDATWVVLFTNKKGEKVLGKPHSLIADFAISPNGKEFAAAVSLTDAYVMPTGGPTDKAGIMRGKTIIQYGKKQWGKAYDGAGVPSFSPNGKHLAYKFSQGSKMGIAIDDDEKAEAQWSFVWSPSFSPDSKRIAYAANQGGEAVAFWKLSSEGDASPVDGGETFVVAHDMRGKKAEQWGPFDEVKLVAFPIKEGPPAFAAKEDKGWRIHCGKTRSELFDEVGPPNFSPDGKQIAFGARSDRELWWQVLTLE